MVYLTQQELDDVKRKVASIVTTNDVIDIHVPGRMRPEWVDPLKPYPTRKEHSGYLLTFRRVGAINWELKTEYSIIKG